MTYTLTSGNSGAVIRDFDGAFIPNDPENSDRLLFEAWLSEGGDPSDAPQPPAATPEPLTARQLRLQLISMGITMATVDGMIATFAEPARSIAQVEWEYATTYEINHPLVGALAAAMGIGQEGIEVAWSEAATR